MLIILLGEIFKFLFICLGIDKKYLICILVDVGVVVNLLIFWGVSGIFIMGMLKVGVLEYLLYVFFLLFCFIIIVILGIFLKK